MLIGENLTCASSGTSKLSQKLQKNCNFCASSIPSFGDAVTRRPLTTGVKFINAGQKADQKRQKRVGLVAFGRVPENFVARGLGARTKGKSRASRFLACCAIE